MKRHNQQQPTLEAKRLERLQILLQAEQQYLLLREKHAACQKRTDDIQASIDAKFKPGSLVHRYFSRKLRWQTNELKIQREEMQQLETLIQQLHQDLDTPYYRIHPPRPRIVRIYTEIVLFFFLMLLVLCALFLHWQH